MVLGVKFRLPWEKAGKVEGAPTVLQQLQELGINMYLLNDKDTRIRDLRNSMKDLQDLDDIHANNGRYTDDKGQEQVMSFEEYVRMRVYRVATLAHIIAVPNGRGGDNKRYADKIIMFNQQIGEFQNWLDFGVLSPVFLNMIFQESLSIVGYSWMEKDITVQKVLVYINPLGQREQPLGEKEAIKFLHEARETPGKKGRSSE